MPLADGVRRVKSASGANGHCGGGALRRKHGRMKWKTLLSVALLAIIPASAVVFADNVANGVATKSQVPTRAKPTSRSNGNAILRLERARPGLWLLSDQDTKIWLFGTVHVLPAHTQWRSRVLDQAMAESQELVLEIAPDKMKDGSAGLAMLQLGVSDGLPPIRARVPADKQRVLVGMIDKSKLPEALFDRLESWAAGFTLVGVQFAQLGLETGSGVEDALTTRFQQAGKPIVGLETPIEQLGYFDGLSEDSQRAFLASMLEDPTELRGEFDAMLAAWARGDERAIVASFDEEANLTDELRTVLLNKRNARWADWLAKRLEKPGTVMVAVGAGHLAGPESVQAMLQQRGLATKRMQ